MGVLLKNELYKLHKNKKPYIFTGVSAALIIVAALAYDYKNYVFNGQMYPQSTGAAFLFIIYMATVVGDMISEEYKNGTLKMTMLQPVNRIKIFIAKAITLIIAIIFLQIVYLLLSYIIGTLYFGWGDSFSYSFYKLDLSGTWNHTTQQFSAISGVLITAVHYFLILFPYIGMGMSILFASVLFFNTGTTTFIAIAFWEIGEPYLKNIQWLRPFILDSYFGFLGAFFPKADIWQIVVGIGVLLTYIGVFFAAGAYLFQKKNVLS